MLKFCEQVYQRQLSKDVIAFGGVGEELGVKNDVNVRSISLFVI